MMEKFIKGRVYVFIDAENLFYAQRTLGWLISYEKLMNYFRKACGSDVKCFVYTGRDEHNIGQQKFLDMLEMNGYIVRTKVVKKIRSRDGSYKWKNNLDMELAFEMDDTKEKYDTAVLISGDSDFVTPIERIKKAGKRIMVMSTRCELRNSRLRHCEEPPACAGRRDEAISRNCWRLPRPAGLAMTTLDSFVIQSYSRSRR